MPDSPRTWALGVSATSAFTSLSCSVTVLSLRYVSVQTSADECSVCQTPNDETTTKTTAVRPTKICRCLVLSADAVFASLFFGILFDVFDDFFADIAAGNVFDTKTRAAVDFQY